MTLVWSIDRALDVVVEKMARNKLFVGMEVDYVGWCEDFDKLICVIDVDIDESSEGLRLTTFLASAYVYLRSSLSFNTWRPCAVLSVSPQSYQHDTASLVIYQNYISS